MLIDNESVFRFVFFVSVLIVMMGMEVWIPKKKRRLPRLGRWFTNLGIVCLDALLIRILVPVLPIGVATIAADEQWGLFHLVDLPVVVSVLLSLVLLDLIIYFQHRIFHKVPWLWRLHSVHHTDLDLDVTSGNRFHPIEIAISIAVKSIAIVMLGVAPGAVIIFEIMLNAFSQFNHSNINIKHRLQNTLNWFVVTPDMHRIHHSVIPSETNSNYGFNIPWWDRLFGTYRSTAIAGNENMVLGVAQHQHKSYRLVELLMLPFRR